jgi:quinol---cytochrome c reductase iron-sulfur subunit, bacillus type
MISRRGFFETMIAALAGIIGLCLFVPLIGYAILPALRRKKSGWEDLGPISKLKPDQPQQLDFLITKTDGWYKTTATQWVWAVRHDDGTVTAFSPRCPHLGCAYHWDGDAQKFECPCHGSVFSMDGTVLAGPSPRPLDTLPIKIEGGRLLVIYEQFKAGTKKKTEI